MDIYTFDVETKSVVPSMQHFGGLEPWRVRHGTSIISSAAVCNPDGTVEQIINDGPDFVGKLTAMLKRLEDQVVYAHFTVFDIAWCIATLQPDRMGDIPELIRRIRWRDTALLARWLVNGQKAEQLNVSYSLASMCSIFLPDEPLTEEFVKMKGQQVESGDDSGYWETRGELDVIMTHKLASILQPRLPVEQRAGFITEMADLIPIANSWIIGLRIDGAALNEAEQSLSEEFNEIIKQLAISASVISSPKQLGALLFVTWGLKPHSKTPTGTASTSKDDLKWIHYNLLNENQIVAAEKLNLLLRAKTIATLQSKYVKTTKLALDHTTDGYIYGAPRIFGTYTGRMTYSNATLRKYKTGIALHQMPRRAKQIRKFIIAPESYMIYEADASGQESRLMALKSKDRTMITIFQDDLNFHSMTGASIISMEYTEFEIARKLEDDTGYYTEQRQFGKLTNLSCNYRIGGKSLSEKAFVNYDTFMDVRTGMHLVNTFNKTYSGVPDFWDNAIEFARTTGYAEAYGGLRFKIFDWHNNRWASESSAINLPIQGSGASMKEIAILETYKKEPRAKFILDLHDASFFYIPIKDSKEIIKNLDNILNTIDYLPYWGFTPEIPLPYESKHGNSFADVK